MGPRLLLFYISSGLSIISIIIEVSATEEIQRNSADYIILLQKHRNSHSDKFFKIISSASMYISVLIGYILFLVFKAKSGILCIIITYTGLWLGNLMKNILSHPRPFWFDSDIEAISCPLDYGAPSGHATTVGSTIFFFFLNYFEHRKVLTSVLCFASLVLVGVDRNYLGVHFYFQVVLGYSFAFFISAGFLLKKTWMAVKSSGDSPKRLVLAQLIGFFMLFLGVIIYFVRDPEMKEVWRENYKDKCGKNLERTDSLYDPLEESSGIMIPVGLLLGLYFKKPKKNRSWVYKLISLIIFSIGLIIEQVIEIYIKKLERPLAFFLLTFLRYLIGLYISVFTTFIVSYFIRCVKKSNIDGNN